MPAAAPRQGAVKAPTGMPLVGRDDPPPVLERNPAGASAALLVCDHAGRRIPARLGTLGLPAAQRRRHIAWDAGAAAVCADLSRRLDAHGLWQRYSRLVIDCNRPLDAPDSIVTHTDGTPVPGNADLSPGAIAARRAGIFQPWHERIGAALDDRRRAGRASALIAIHSFTPMLGATRRPWHVGVMYGRQPTLARALLVQLQREPGLLVGDNEPYALDDASDYTLPVHGEGRGVPCAGIELRQDLLASAPARAAWAARLAAAIDAVLRSDMSGTTAVPAARHPP